MCSLSRGTYDEGEEISAESTQSQHLHEKSLLNIDMTKVAEVDDIITIT